MAVETLLKVDYARQNLGQRDQAETYRGQAEVKVTATMVQLVDHGMVIVEIEKTDWVHIAGSVCPG